MTIAQCSPITLDWLLITLFHSQKFYNFDNKLFYCHLNKAPKTCSPPGFWRQAFICTELKFQFEWDGILCGSPVLSLRLTRRAEKAPQTKKQIKNPYKCKRKKRSIEDEESRFQEDRSWSYSYFFPGAFDNSMCVPGSRQSGFLGRRPLLGNRKINKVFDCLVGMKRQNWRAEEPRIQWKKRAGENWAWYSRNFHLKTFAKLHSCIRQRIKKKERKKESHLKAELKFWQFLFCNLTPLRRQEL